MNFKIVADSSCNVWTMPDVDFAAVPLTIHTDLTEYVDTPDLQVASMVAELQGYKGKSSTACPGVGDWLNAFGDADCVFAVAITSGLSGSYNAAVQAALAYREEQPDKKVYVVDSLSAGPEPELLLEKLREWILSGRDFDEICKEIEVYKKHTHLVFSLESVNNLARNGRCSPVVAKMVGLLGIRIVGKASQEGTLQPLHKCRGEKKALEKLIEVMKELGYAGGKVRIAHCFNEQASEELRSALLQQFPKADILMHSCGGLCSFYAEQGGILIGFEG